MDRGVIGYVSRVASRTSYILRELFQVPRSYAYISYWQGYQRASREFLCTNAPRRRCSYTRCSHDEGLALNAQIIKSCEMSSIPKIFHQGAKVYFRATATGSSSLTNSQACGRMIQPYTAAKVLPDQRMPSIYRLMSYIEVLATRSL
jgi:hypothetical protein